MRPSFARPSFSACVLAATVILVPPPALAQIEIGPMAGTEYGVGAMLRAGAGGFRVEGGAGFTPVLVFVSVIGGSSIFNAYFPPAVGAKASFRIREPAGPKGTQFDIEVGATHNDLLRMGFGGGINARTQGSRLLASGGVMFFPDARDRLRERINRDEGTNFSDSEFDVPLSTLQPYVSIAIMLGGAPASARRLEPARRRMR